MSCRGGPFPQRMPVYHAPPPFQRRKWGKVWPARYVPGVRSDWGGMDTAINLWSTPFRKLICGSAMQRSAAPQEGQGKSARRGRPARESTLVRGMSGRIPWRRRAVSRRAGRSTPVSTPISASRKAVSPFKGEAKRGIGLCDGAELKHAKWECQYPAGRLCFCSYRDENLVEHRNQQQSQSPDPDRNRDFRPRGGIVGDHLHR